MSIPDTFLVWNDIFQQTSGRCDPCGPCEMGKLWEVIGGAEKGGILVRQGAKDLDVLKRAAETRVNYGTINKKAYRNGGIFQKISLSSKQIAIKLQFGIARYHIRCWNINMYTVWSFEHVPILCVVWVQHCLWRYCLRYVHKIVFKFSLICNISISRHVATEFR